MARNNPPKKIRIMDVKGRWKDETLASSDLPVWRFLEITPAMALDILKNHSQKNRNLDKRRVTRYKLAMVAGRWRPSNDDVCFDESGRLQNAYHRLTAISEIDIPIKMGVKFGMPPEAVESMDEGRPRSLANVATMMEDNPNRHGLSGAAFMLEATSAKWTMGREIQRRFYLKYQDIFDGVAVHLAKEMARGPIIAALSRAIIHFRANNPVTAHAEFQERVYEFASAISSIDFRTDSNAPGRLRDFIIRHARGRQNGSERLDLFLKTCSALQNFLDRRNVERLSAVEEGIWPIPEERDGVSIAENMYVEIGGNLDDWNKIRQESKNKKRPALAA